jgi:DNA-binding CsgD family transcriptional regulator
VIDICAQLNGIPLAIELAAARLRTLGVEGLRTRLGDRLQMLTGGARDVPERHRTLKAALEWSYGLLSPAEQNVFRRLGVMTGSFDVAAAQSVTADTGLDQWSLLDALDGLCGKSLLIAATTPEGEARFQLLETMRHFALDRLRAENEEHAARERHLAHFLGLAEAATTFLDGPQQGKWLARLDQDRDNLFAAHRSCDVMPDGVERGLRIANSLMRYWFNRVALLQGQQIIEEAIARPGVEEQGKLYALGLMNSGRIFAFRGLDTQSQAQFERAVAVARRCAADEIAVESMGRMGYAYLGLNNRAAARAVLEEASSLALDLPKEFVRARTVSFANLAELERMEGHYKAAAPMYEEVLALNLGLGDRQATMIALNNLSMMALALGNWSVVRQRLLESLVICDELDSRRGRLVVMEAASGLAAELGHSADAVFFDAAARYHTLAMGRRRDVVDEAFLAPRTERARKAIGLTACATEEAKASASDYGAAVLSMRVWLEKVPVAAKEERTSPEIASGVTAREREVASLIARGFNNGDIAQLLDISVLTVRTHRQRLMDKLEVRNAAEITAYAVKMGWYDPS